MEYTDCDNCAFLEAQITDLQFENEELQEENDRLREAIADFQLATEDLV